MAVHAAWPALGVAPTRHTIDATPIVEAASRAVVFWPDVPYEVTSEPELSGPPLDLPAGSWFEQVLRRDEPG